MEAYKVSDLRLDFEIPQNVTPEYLLWVAVVDRAISDFCAFAEWYRHRVAHAASKTKKRASTSEIAIIRELSVLEWFLFDRQPRECNLQWIAENVFNCGTGICDDIRQRCLQGHKANLDRHAGDPQFARLFALYEERIKHLITGRFKGEIDITALNKPRIRRVVLFN